LKQLVEAARKKAEKDARRARTYASMQEVWICCTR
jgi:hypothetical protein